MSSIDDNPETSNIDAFYEKGNFFRVVHADGVYGGLTPANNVHLAFYNERPAIPRRVAVPVKNGVPGPEVVLESRGGVFREVEVDVMMSFPAAVQFYLWLEGQLDAIRRLMGVTDEVWQEMQVKK